MSVLLPDNVTCLKLLFQLTAGSPGLLHYKIDVLSFGMGVALKSAGATQLPLPRRQSPPMRLDGFDSSKADAVVGFDVDHRSHSYVEQPRGDIGDDPKCVWARPRKITNITARLRGVSPMSREIRRDRFSGGKEPQPQQAPFSTLQSLLQSPQKQWRLLRQLTPPEQLKENAANHNSS